MSSQPSSLSKRGAELASAPNMRDKALQILGRDWHPENNPDGYVQIGSAENHIMLDEVANFIKSKDLKLDGHDINSGEGPWGSVRLRNGLAEYFNDYFSPHTRIDAEDIICASGCTSLFNMLSLVLGDPGDGLLLSMPSYVAFASDFNTIGKMKPIYVPFATTDQFQPAAILHYEKALQQASASGTRIRALMLCNPHNPLGRCYPPSSLIALMQFCNKHKIHLIADEVYAMSVYSTSAPTDTPFTSVFALDWEKYIDSKYLHQVYGMSKDFAASGLRIGCVWSKNEEFKRAMCALGGFHWPGQVDERVAVTIFEDKEFVAKFQKTALEKLVEANKLAMKMLDEAKIPYAPGANAGFFLWLDLSQWLEADDWAAEEKLTQRMVDEKVFLTPGRAQGSEKAGFFRFVFAREEVVLREGIRRLKICLNI